MFVVAGMIGLALFLPRLIDVNAYRDDIIAGLQQSLNRKVSFSRGEFSMHLGPSFTFDNVVVKELDGAADLLTARRIVVHLSLLPLLEKKVVLRDVVLEGAVANLARDVDGKLNIDDLLRPRPEAYQVHLKKVQIRKGKLLWRDMAVQKPGFAAVVQNLDLEIDSLTRGHKGRFKLAAELPARSGTSALVALSGTARLPAAGMALSETELNANCDIRQFEAGRFWPYYGSYIPFGNTGGRLDLATSFKGRLREFSSKGRLRLAGVVVNWPTIFHHPVNPKLAQLDFEFKLGQNDIDMPALQFSADGFKIKGSCRLQDIRSRDLRLTARASSEPFRLEGLRQWIPYGIIADDTSRYIEEHITGGLFRLETGSLDGRISQIVQMGKGTNYNILHIKGTVEKGVVSYGSKAPLFANIKAGLELLGKDFILSRASGTFGDSPFRLEGRITDYPLEKIPCQYPFQMEMVPRPAEVAWLARLAGAEKLEFRGDSRLLLKGSGIVAAYQLTGDWDLKQAGYTFPGAVRKTSGLQNHLTFSSVLSARETRVTSLTYNLAQLSISATAQLGYGEKPHLGFELQTNPFLMNETLPILTAWQSYHPRGKLQAHIKGSGDPENFAAMDYNGTIALSGFGFQPAEGLKPVSNINGTVMFRGNSLETSSIAVRYGSSQLHARGRVRNFSNPEAEISLSSPEFHLRDLVATPPKQDASIRRMQASFTLRDKTCTISSFTGQVNSSGFSISGSYSGGGSPEANLSVSSSFLDVNDLLMLTRAVSAGGKGPQPELKLKLAVEAGHYGKLQFSRLNASLNGNSGVFYLQGLDAGIYGGRLLAKGRIASDGALGNRYDLNLNLERINGERLFQALDISREVSGTLNLQGDITARGSTLTEVKKSALGNLRLRLEKGSLRKFSVLSKLFSILNFSQLLKLQLPDMVHGGMPYNEIKGSFSVRDGIVATQDLFIKGDAINISILGSTDLIREELNFTIGVQPLQTVDKVVNRIPVVGWLLTGKGRVVVTAYFEARGKWSDPQVKAIPVKSMAKGALNIFRRVFELPVRLFTDTGEVLLGQ
jgi:uncharacterized protein involved in outer membrane biogenesis